jgi:hypothetical protein
MSLALESGPVRAPGHPGAVFAISFAAVAIAAAVVSGLFPVWFSIVIVFLFAGPHNWMEARYILGRLPARAGKLHGFFLVSAAGIIALAATYPALPFLGEFASIGMVLALWDTAFLFWIAALIQMRANTNPRFDGGWVWSAACLLTAGVWLDPVILNVVLVYLHPVLALVLLDRELGRSHPAWRPAYRAALPIIPACLAILWFQLADLPDLPGSDRFNITFMIADHSGAGILNAVSTHFLVAAHTFLEMVHYAAWVVLIPLIGMRSWPWELKTIPAARRNASWARGVKWLLLAGLGLVLILWLCFTLDYATTRVVYFNVALLHVLAEIPFLLRMV